MISKSKSPSNGLNLTSKSQLRSKGLSSPGPVNGLFKPNQGPSNHQINTRAKAKLRPMSTTKSRPRLRWNWLSSQPRLSSQNRLSSQSWLTCQNSTSKLNWLSSQNRLLSKKESTPKLASILKSLRLLSQPYSQVDPNSQVNLTLKSTLIVKSRPTHELISMCKSTSTHELVSTLKSSWVKLRPNQRPKMKSRSMFELRWRGGFLYK